MFQTFGSGTQTAPPPISCFDARPALRTRETC